jgi:hypothetical protein
VQKFPLGIAGLRCQCAGFLDGKKIIIEFGHRYPFGGRELAPAILPASWLIHN